MPDPLTPKQEEYLFHITTLPLSPRDSLGNLFAFARIRWFLDVAQLNSEGWEPLNSSSELYGVPVVQKHSPGRSPQSCPSGDFTPFNAEIFQNDFSSIWTVENGVFRETEKHALDHFF